MSNMRFNTVSTHPSKKWDMRLVHAIFLWRKITSIVDLCVIAALFFFVSPVGRVVHTSRGAWKFASITQQVLLFWHRLLSPCCSLTVLYTKRVLSTRNSFASLRNRLFLLLVFAEPIWITLLLMFVFSLSPCRLFSFMFWKLLAITGNRPGLFCFCFFSSACFIVWPERLVHAPCISTLREPNERYNRTFSFRSGCSSVVPSVTTSDAESEKKRTGNINGDGVKVSGRWALSLLSTWISSQDSKLLDM